MSYYQFDSFHVNIGSGDGAIHILSSPLQNGRRKVERAFFIDGERTTAKDYINLTIVWIQENFFCPGPYDDGRTAIITMALLPASRMDWSISIISSIPRYTT